MVLVLRRRAVAAIAIALLLGMAVMVTRLAAASGGTKSSEPLPADAVLLRVPTRLPAIALTFDDGPDPQNTPGVLAGLRAHGAVATFFVTGRQVDAFPALVQQERAEGSEVCNHSWRHPVFRGMSPGAVGAELGRTEARLTALGVGGCRLFRFPYFSSDGAARAAVAALGYRMIGASVDTQDWRGRSAPTIAKGVLAQVRPGDIVLMHDGGGPRPRTVAALGLILDGLPGLGLRTATVTQLLASAAGGATSPAG